MKNEIIKKERLKRGLSCAKLAEKVNVSGAAINRYETGKVKPFIRFAKKIADFFDLDLEELDYETRNRGIQKTHEEFVEEFNDISDGEYELLGKYKKAHTKVKVKHKECGNVYMVAPASFLSGRKCPECFGNPNKGHENFIKEVKELVGDEYSVLTKYINTNSKIKLKHNECGHEWFIVAASFLSGVRCPMCQHRSFKKTTDEYKKELKEEFSDFIVVSEYEGANSKIKLKHKDCGYVLETTPHGFNGICTNCSLTFGEGFIKRFLVENNLKYKREFTFEDCRDKNVLRFDFAVFDKNDKLYCLIEYDGEMHYKIIENYTSNKNLNNQIKRDKIKNDYCFKNNIKLIRIPYFKFDILEEILKVEMVDLL